MSSCPRLLIALVALAAFPPAPVASRSGPPEESYTADLITVPRNPLARRWTRVKVTVFREQDRERVLVPRATAVATVNGEGEPARTYALETPDQGPVFETEMVFPRPGTYSLAFDITPSDRPEPFQTTFVVRVGAARLPPADRAVLLVVNVGSRDVSLVDAERFELAGTVALPGTPVCMFYDEGAPRLWLAFAGSEEADGKPVAKAFDPVELTETEQVKLLFLPSAMVADATRLFLANEQANSVTWFERGNPEQATTVEVGYGPRALRLLPERGLLCVADADVADADPFDSLSVVDLAKQEEIVRLPVGQYPVALAVAPESDLLYVCSAGDGRVTAVDTKSWSIAATIGVPGQPVAIVPGRKPGSAIAVCRLKKCAALVDIVPNSVPLMLPLPAAPDHVVADATPARTVFISCSEANGLISLPASGKGEVRTVGVGNRPAAAFFRKAVAVR